MLYLQYEKLRKNKGVSNYRVAKDTGIPQPTLSDWKSGKSTPKYDKIQIIADYFGVPVDFFTKKSEVGCPWCSDEEYPSSRCSLISNNGRCLADRGIPVTCIANYCPKCGRRLI